MRAILIALVLLCSPSLAFAGGTQPTCVWLGDSIDSYVENNEWYNKATTHLIENERDVSIRNLSTPGAAMAGTFGGAWVTEALDQIEGHFNYVDCLVITAGTNDFGNPYSTSQLASDALIRILNWARDNNVKVLVVDLIWRSAAESATWGGLTLAQYRNSRAFVCGGYINCRYTARPTAFNTANAALYASSEAPNNLTHPNAAGHRARATWIEQAGDGFIW